MNKIKYTAVLLLGGLLSLSSCTDNFAGFNDTKGAYTDNSGAEAAGRTAGQRRPAW